MVARFQGVFTPLVTPLTALESPDLASIERLVQFQIEGAVDGIWAMGTSAEFAGFDEDERARVIDTIVATAGTRIPVIANVSDASTRLAIRHGRRALASGAVAIAATPPYYYPHTQDELLAHYRAIRDAVDLPLLVYNIPQTVRLKLELRTMETLVAEGVVQGIKDSQNDLEWLRQLAVLVGRGGWDFSLFAGTRFLIDAAVLCGATGVVPSLANAFPELCVSAFRAARDGNFAASRDIEEKIIDLEGFVALTAGGSRNAAVLGLLKSILSARGIIDRPDLTSPLRTWAEGEQRQANDAVETVSGERFFVR